MLRALCLIASILPVTTAFTVNTTGLQPWEITDLWTHNPSGFPNNHPYWSIGFSVNNPNHIVVGQTHFGPAEFWPSATNCSVYFTNYNDTPQGKTIACAESTSYGDLWWFEITKDSPSFETNFTLRITREEAVILESGANLNLRWEGQAHFQTGYQEPGVDNMSGACGGSGQCSWGLAEGKSPVLALPRLVEVQCLAGDCDDPRNSSS